MVVNCAVPHCTNKWKKYRPLRFFRLPVQQIETLKQWLVVLNIDLSTPFEKLYNVRVCSDHFSEDDYSKPVKNPTADFTKCRLLKKTAVPSVSSSPTEAGIKILHSVGISPKVEVSEDPAYDELEVTLSSDDLLSDSESPEEEDTKKKKHKSKKNHSSDEWEPPAHEAAKDSDNSEMSVDEEESDDSDGLENDGSMPVVGCEDCDTEARLQCSLLRHQKLFACSQCVSAENMGTRCLDKLLVRFTDYQSFQVHAEEEHGLTTKRVLCQECGVFYVKPTEANGKKEHVCEYKTKHLVCPNCDKRFRTEKGLKAHTRKLHGDTMHPCKYCLMPFRNRPAKLEHEETHPKEDKPYLCPDCPEKFRNIVKRNRHMRSHRGPWKYLCKTCGKGFPHLDRLERHELIHSGIKPFRCEVCERSFTQEGHLKSHMRLHTGEKPYKCKLCEKSFTHNVSLKSHVLRYHSSITAAPPHPPPHPPPPPPAQGVQENSIPKARKKSQGRPKGRPKRVLANEEQENGGNHQLS
ncbi:zinc finger protein 124-like isoform X2 [Pygocentrus nattereri]|uniref:zinc finger protein 124-like isoform X2 n=1 Tax=Pygocentrus nattereri TaxID=42514 RepID=UPI0008148372|nr:zinc finger protein 124-like isoform X2 [Pygocentrus nattereri]